MAKGIKIGRLARIATIVIATPIVLLWALLLLLYLPPVQKYAINEIENIVAANSEFRLNVGSIGLSFPLKLAIKDFTLTNREDSIAAGKEIAASVRMLPLLRGAMEVDYLALEETRVDTRDLMGKTRIRGNIGYFRTVARNIDLVTEKANIKYFNLHDTNATIDIGKSDSPDNNATDVKWIIELQKGNIENTELAINIPDDSLSLGANIKKMVVKEAVADIYANKYTVNEFGTDGSAITYESYSSGKEGAKDITINDITLHSENIIYSHPLYAVEIKELSFVQPDGVSITEGKITASVNADGIDIPAMTIRSANGTFIEGSTQIPLNITASANSPVAANLSALIDKRDIEALLSPEQTSSFNTLPDSLLNFGITLNGTIEDINIETAGIEIPRIAQIELSGNITNIADSTAREAAIALDGRIMDASRIMGTPLDSTATPLNIAGESRLQGDLCYADISITGKGNGKIIAYYDIKSDIYNTKISTEELDIKATIPAIPLTGLTMQAALSGQGTDIFNSGTYYQLVADIDSINYNSTALNSIILSAFQANSLAFLSVQSYCRDASFTLLSNNRLDSLKVTTDTKLNIYNIDLAALKIGKSAISGSGNLNIKAGTDLNETHTLNLSGSGITINTPQKRYTPHPLYIDFATAPAGSHINIENGDLTFKGKLASGYTHLLKQTDKLQKLISDASLKRDTMYYATEFEKLLPATDVNFKCRQDNLLANILAINNISFTDIELSAGLDTMRGIRLKGKADNFTTADFKADSIRMGIGQRGDNITFFTRARNTSKEKKQQFTAALRGSLNKDTLNTNIFFKGYDNESRTSIGCTTYIKPQELDIHFAPKGYFIGTPITINNDNHITIGKERAVSANLAATDKRGAGLHLYTVEDSAAKHDITLELSDIDLATLTSTFPYIPDITGTLNCDIRYRNDNNGRTFSGDIICDSIAYEGTYIGNEIVEAVYLPKKNGSHYLALLMHHNDEEILNLAGDYNDESNNITGSTTITNFPLQIANAFLKESGLDIGGHIDGKLSLNGNITTPQSDGYIKFDSVHIDAPLLGSRLRLMNDKVDIKENRMLFDRFKIYAKGDTPFNIDGNIDISNILNPLFNIKMRAKNYALVNARRQKNSIVYGNLNMNINSTIKGPANSLNINGNATILGNTNVTYVMEESSIANDNEFDGLVEFVNQKDTTSTRHNEEIPQLGNITMAITLDIEESAWINADLTPDRSSYIQLQGGGHLNMNYNYAEGLTLTGRYTLNNGEMKYSLPVIPLKTFNISPGSYIHWTGDALNPLLQITALERVVAPVSIDGGNTQPVAFDVGVDLSNSLEDMALSFTMKAPENAVIQDELNKLDAETLNKYAVTMLITGAYVGSKGGLTVSNALTSFLDAKINDIAGNAMKNVSINVGIADVENSETGGSYMNYSFSFAKRFWNDRLTIIVGGEVNSGDRPESNESFINNISLEWKINNSGNRYLRIFYDKNYESILEGEITETGVGYIYKRKLNKLNELLYLKKRDKQPRTKATTDR